MNEFNRIEYLNKELLERNETIWIYPSGNLSDMFILNTILHRFSKQYAPFKFNMVNRSASNFIFKSNPSIKEFGFPQKGATILFTNYWERDEFKIGDINSFDLFSKIFMIEFEKEQKIEFEYSNSENSLFNTLPYSTKNILIAPFVDNPLCAVHPLKWHKIVESLLSENYTILQIGNSNDIHIKGAYSLLGVLNHIEIAYLITKMDFIITSDNFVKELASISGKPTVVFSVPQFKNIPKYVNQQIIKSETIEHNECSNCFYKDYSLELNICKYYFDNYCINLFDESLIYKLVNSKLNT